MSNKPQKNKYRQKVIEAIVYFSKELKHPNKTVINKSLAELDFRHFKATGFPVTDLEYEAYPKGPVPAKLHNEITINKDVILPEDFKEALDCRVTEYEKNDLTVIKEYTFVPKRKPNLEIFTPRQLDILKEVADIYREAQGFLASDASHERGTPWNETVKKNGGKIGVIIDMVETIPLSFSSTKEETKENLEEWKAMIYNYTSPQRG